MYTNTLLFIAVRTPILVSVIRALLDQIRKVVDVAQKSPPHERDTNTTRQCFAVTPLTYGCVRSTTSQWTQLVE